MHWLEIGVFDMNKRMKKKHKWLGVKRAGANYCANEIFRHILRKMIDSGIPLKPCYIRNAKSYVRWLFHNSSEEEWLKRAADAYDPFQRLLSAKHLIRLPADYTSFSGRYKPNQPISIDIDDLAEKRKDRKEKLLSGENVDIDNPQSMYYRIKSYEEYGATGNRSPQYAKDMSDMVDKNE